MKFNGGKCELLHLGQSNPTHPFRGLGDNKLLVGYKCTQAAMKAKHVLGCIRHGTASKSRAVVVPLQTALVRPLVITLAKESDRLQVIYFSHISTNIHPPILYSVCLCFSSEIRVI